MVEIDRGDSENGRRHTKDVDHEPRLGSIYNSANPSVVEEQVLVCLLGLSGLDTIKDRTIGL